MRLRTTIWHCAILVISLLPACSWAEIAIPVITDPNNGEGGFGSFGGGPIAVDDTANFDGNDFIVYTMTQTTPVAAAGGGGFSVSISNGENGIDIDDNGNEDNVNTEPLDPAIAAVNSGMRLQNGNAIRASAWFQQDPNDPITLEPSVEPVFKFELWKEYDLDHSEGDFTSGRKSKSDFGDRLWDTDINAPDPFWDGFDQSQASRIDVNNNGVIASGDPLTASLPPTTGGFEWVLVESTIIIDDTPDNAPGFNWEIGTVNFDVTTIERVTAVMFVGDYAAQDLTGGGSFWVDNIMLEVFVDEAAMLSTPTPNPVPEADAGISGDFNNDMVVDAADYALWRNEYELGNMLLSDYDLWRSNYGAGVTAGIAPTTSAAPEPVAVALLSIGLLSFGGRRRS